jgi:signal transduction histidine kinase
MDRDGARDWIQVQGGCLIRRLLLSYLSLTAIVLVTLAVPLGITYVRSERRVLLSDEAQDAMILASVIQPALASPGDSGSIPAIVEGYADRFSARIVVVDRQGISVADSDDPGAAPRSFASRPEFARALSGTIATGIRRSETLGYDLAFAAVPVASGGTVHGALRITFPARELASTARRTSLLLAGTSVVVLGLVVLVGWLLAHSVTKPIRALEATATGFSGGDLGLRADETEGPEEVRSLARAFNETASRLDVLVQSQKAFVAEASHELRTPLTALRLRLENLAAGASEDNRAHLEPAIGETRRLSEILNGLLVLSRADQAAAQPKAVDVAAVLNSRVRFWEPAATAKGLQLEVDRDPDGKVLAESGYLEQMIDNLISNAVEASPPGTKVTLSARRSGDWMEIRVMDQGSGMSDSELRRAFDRFWKGGGSRGTGLGLAIVAQMAKANGGTASLRRRESGGMEAILRLPAATAAR